MIGEAAGAIRHHIGALRPSVAVVLGSGLGDFAGRLSDPVRIPYSSIPGFPLPSVAGHSGELVAGRVGETPVLAQRGRFHLYEGHEPDVVALPIRVFAALGVGVVILTNAAGAVRPTFTPGTLMLLSDHINLTGRNPLVGPVRAGDERFPDMLNAYDASLRALARSVAARSDIALEEGVYAGLLGPSYETAAEVRMLERLGADAVGMSTVVEVIAARAAGLRCLAVSTIANPACGLSPTPITHAEVLAVCAAAGERVGDLIAGVIADLPRD